MVRDRLGVVSGTGGHDASSTFFVRQLKQLVERPAVLERARALASLELEPERARQKIAKRYRSSTGGEHHLISEAFAGLENVR
jgi:hypothetical protein